MKHVQGGLPTKEQNNERYFAIMERARYDKS